MAENFDVIAMLKANISDFKSGMKEAEGTLTSFKQHAGSTFQNIGNLTSGVGTALTVGVTAPLIAAGGVAFNFAADMEDAMGATDQIFGSASSSVKDWANSLESYYGIAESEALEYSNTMGSMLKNIGGLTEQEAASTSATLMELAGDLTAMYGGTVESAVQALTGALKGNNSMLDNYGMGVNEAVIKAKALEMGLSDGTGELTLQAKQAATLALIMEQTADAQGQAAREADGASGSMRALMIEIKNLATELGGVLLPIITPFISKLKDVVARFREMTPEQQENIVKWAMIAAAIGPVLIVLGKIIAFLPSLIAGFKALGVVFAIITSPIGLVVAAIAAVVGVILYLWKTNETFRNHVMIVWEAIKNIVTTTISAILSLIKSVVSSIASYWSSQWQVMLGLVSSVWDAIVTLVSTAIQTAQGIITAIMQAIQGDWSGAWETFKSTVSNAASGVASAVTTVMQGAYDAVTSWFSNFMSAGANIVGMIADGIKGAVGKVTGAIGSVVSKIREYLPFSPAKTGPLKDIHRLNFGGTIADSIYRDAHKPLKAMQDLTSGIRNTWSNQVGNLNAQVGGSLKRSVETSVNVQNNSLNSLFTQLLNRQQYLVLDTGAFVGSTQAEYDKANGKVFNLQGRVRR